MLGPFDIRVFRLHSDRPMRAKSSACFGARSIQLAQNKDRSRKYFVRW